MFGAVEWTKLTSEIPATLFRPLSVCFQAAEDIVSIRIESTDRIKQNRIPTVTVLGDLKTLIAFLRCFAFSCR